MAGTARSMTKMAFPIRPLVSWFTLAFSVQMYSMSSFQRFCFSCHSGLKLATLLFLTWSWLFFFKYSNKQEVEAASLWWAGSRDIWIHFCFILLVIAIQDPAPVREKGSQTTPSPHGKRAVLINSPPQNFNVPIAGQMGGRHLIHTGMCPICSNKYNQKPSFLGNNIFSQKHLANCSTVWNKTI